MDYLVTTKVVISPIGLIVVIIMAIGVIGVCALFILRK